MTKKELSQVFWLNLEIAKDEERIASLRAYGESTNAKISGLPHISGISDKTAIAADIVDAQAIIELKKRQCIAEFNKINQYINTVDNSLIRQIMQHRFIDGFNWTQVAWHIGGNNTANGLRMMLDRHLSKQ